MAHLVTYLLALFAIVACTHGQGPEELFGSFKATYGKTYGSPEEEARRFAVFQENMERVAKLREGLDDPEVFGVTKFSDLTPEEFQARLFPRRRLQDGQPYPPGVVRSPPAGFQPPASLDWREKNMVGAIRDQGDCGSCWAHSVVEEIESMRAMATKKPIEPLSVQEVVSCDVKQKWPCDKDPQACKNVDDGCDGGDPPFGILFVCNDTHGLATEADYPSESGKTGKTMKCKKGEPQVKIPCTGFSWAAPPCNYKQKCAHQNMTLFKANMAAYGPVSISVDATNGWQSYTGGIYPARTCSNRFSELDHSIQAIGYGTEGSKAYYIVRNSWGTDWGEKGYMRLEAEGPDGDPCGIADEALFVDF